MMCLHVVADREGALTAEWGCNVLTTPPSSYTFTTNAFTFRAVISVDDDIEVQLASGGKCG